MARKLRLESAGGLYHIFNRGLDHARVFRSEKTKRVFLNCLQEACEKTGWRVYAWCVMSNHYHLAIETPQPNLVEGMRWLQNTFATRLNGFRKEGGHAFPGRYYSLAVEPARLGPLCHYIHLNPVHEKLCAITALADWRWSSYSWLQQPKMRAGWYSPEPALSHAGELSDTAPGRAKYRAYLARLAEDEPSKNALGFASMCTGSAIGSVRFQKAFATDHKELAAALKSGVSKAEELKEQLLVKALAGFLKKAKKKHVDLAKEEKSAPWKIALGAAMKTRTVATNRWLAAHLHLGHRDETSRKINQWLREPDKHWARVFSLSPKPKV